jgi:hypothetical protein
MKLLPRYSLITYPDGGLITSIEDISKYLMEMIKGYQGESTLMRKDSFREMMRLQSGNKSGMGYGIFFAVWGTGYIGHSGGDPGTTTSIFSLPLPYRGTNSTRSGVHLGEFMRLPSISRSNGHAEMATRQSISAFKAIYSPACAAAGW